MRSPQDDAASKPTCNPDVLVNNVGTLYTFCPLTLRAKEWVDEHVQDDAQWFEYALIVEPQYVWGPARGMKDAGLVLELGGTMLRLMSLCEAKSSGSGQLSV